MENSKAKINFFYEILHDLEDRLGGKRNLSIPMLKKTFTMLDVRQVYGPCVQPALGDFLDYVYFICHEIHILLEVLR